MMSGHGCFADYLAKIGAVNDPSCAKCEADVDSVMHTLTACPIFASQRKKLMAAIGNDFFADRIISAMLYTNKSHMAFVDFCEKVLIIKESNDREKSSRSGKDEQKKQTPKRKKEETLTRVCTTWKSDPKRLGGRYPSALREG